MTTPTPTQSTLSGIEPVEPMRNPETEGKDHINVYSKSTSRLGRELSNFARTRFELDGRMFESVEAWWYWQSLSKQSIQITPEVARGLTEGMLLSSYGFRAKELGRLLHGNTMVSPPTREELKRVYHAKIESNPSIACMLLASELPFDHYYVYGGKAKSTPWRWTGQLWGEIRDELRQRREPRKKGGPAA